MRSITYIVLAIGLVGGCAVNGPPLMRSTGDVLANNAQIAISAPREGNAYETEFSKALANALRDRKFSIVDDGDFVVQYGVAIRDASIGLVRAGDDDKAEVVSASRNRLLLDRCDAQRLRISITVLDRQNGGAVHRSTADVNDCEFPSAQAATLADQLAATLDPEV